VLKKVKCAEKAKEIVASGMQMETDEATSKEQQHKYREAILRNLEQSFSDE